MKRIITYSVFSLFFVLITMIAIKSKSDVSDHSDRLSGPFNTPQEVSAACIECHTEEAEDFIKTRHWNWCGEKFIYKGKEIQFGKKYSFNNFCIAVSSNEPRCTSCHPGFGWTDKNFDFTKVENIDCLVCHEQTGTYKKLPAEAGMPDKNVDLLKVAQSVGIPKKENCGVCHFNGGGGTGVKHGDLDPSLLSGDMNSDIHINGKGFSCIECHKTEKHIISGAGHGSMIQNTNHIYCTNCHDLNKKIHTNSILNKHIDNIACETCHIPYIARVIPTMTYWDWSTAGKREDEFNSDGNYSYSKMKGSFKWEKNIVPEYRWYNGGADYYLIGDKIENDKLVRINTLRGDISDKNAKIAPFKIMRGKQIYDKKNNYLIIPKLFGKDGFWKTYNWDLAAQEGMKEAGLEYSGEFDFIETEMYWTINHSVTKSKDAVKCNDCHGKGTRLNWNLLGYSADPMKKGGRLKNKLIK